MKKYMLYCAALAFMACNQPSATEQEEASSTAQEVSLNEASAAPSCQQSEEKNPESESDPIMTNTCIWKGYTFETVSSPDSKGRYSDTYKVYAADGKETANSAVFNTKTAELEAMINAKFKEDFETLQQDTENADCLSGVKAPNFKINDMRVSLSEQGVSFSVSYGLGGACMAVDGSSASFSLEEVMPFMAAK